MVSHSGRHGVHRHVPPFLCLAINIVTTSCFLLFESAKVSLGLVVQRVQVKDVLLAHRTVP